MNIWEATSPKPLRVRPGEVVPIRVGTWPIAPGQRVGVRYGLERIDGTRGEGAVEATWEKNEAENSYFRAALGPFARGDVVAYEPIASDESGRVRADGGSFRVGPKVSLALLWHQHQPFYRDRGQKDARASIRQPWVRLHAVRDYYAMAALVAEHPSVHLTINLTPALLEQIEDYTDRAATDEALELTLKPAEELSADDRERMLGTFFDADWHRQVFVHARYAELFAKRRAGEPFLHQDLRDLQAWFNLAWFGKEMRDGPQQLVTGEVVSIDGLVRKAQGFDVADLRRIVDEQLKVLRAIVPMHRALQDKGQIEVSTTPYYHPILPLLVDTDRATIDLPGAGLPPRFAHPEDARTQVERACARYERHFGRAVRGMWPAEGAVSQFVVPLFAGAGLKWIASDAGVLARSGRWGYDTARPDVLCQPYVAREGDWSVPIFFRDPVLSDAIGFRYAAWSDSAAAARAFVAEIKERFADRFASGGDRVVTVALDGENAWGSYSDDARPFLRALYEVLSGDPDIATVTLAEYIDGNPSRAARAHPPESLPRVHNLFTGSWIDQYGSSPGVDLGTWIGRPEKNRAWELLGEARAEADRVGARRESSAPAFEALWAAEGSDWFWWFGDDHDSGHNDAFDILFRTHLATAYRELGSPPPPELALPIATRGVAWSPAEPLPAIARGNAIVVQANCPGRLHWSLGDGLWQEAAMKPVGGAMAAIARHQLRLGPFGDGVRLLRVRFQCTHAACDCRQPCCRAEPYEIRLE
jgi:alpha-amylase/alpha-mannosidase (GH57 family)